MHRIPVQHRTPIKMCGFTRTEDVHHAIRLGIDAVGFVLFPGSSRAVTLAQACELAALLPPFTTPVLLFVNPTADQVQMAIRCLPRALLQFHGDETPDFCAGFGHPYIRAARIPTGNTQIDFNLIDFAQRFRQAQGILLDSFSPQFGGTGHAFDWSALPASVPAHLVLGGGLTAHNVGNAMAQLRQTGWSLGLDVSSGIEAAKGIKDAEKMTAFVQAVRQADAIATSPTLS